MRCRRSAGALLAGALLVGGCLEPPLDAAPPPLTAEEDPGDRPSALDEVERHAMRVTLRVRNLGCGGIAVGSGFAVGEDTLVTNRHVIAGADRLEVNTWDGRRLVVDVAQAAASHDLALVRVQADLPAVAELADHDPQPGEEVVVAGHPGGGSLVVRRGAVRGHVEDVLFGAAAGAVALDVPLEPGSSGSAVLDLDGQVVGVVYGVSGDGQTSVAVPVTALRDVGDADLGDVPPCP